MSCCVNIELPVYYACCSIWYKHQKRIDKIIDILK